MKLVAALFAGLVLAGCGEAAQKTAVPGSSAPVESSGVTETSDSPAPIKPPEIALVSAAGKQIALLSTYCVTATDPSTGQGQGGCADGAWPHPRRVTVVHPGDGVSVVLSDASVGRDGEITVLPLGCEHAVVRTIPLTAGRQSTAFAVDLETGAYELQVFAPFEAADGRSGDVSGGLGLVVAPDSPPSIDGAPQKRSGC